MRSLSRALAGLPDAAEVLLVDDGSQPALETQLGDFAADLPLRHLRQPNQGSIVARLTGLAAARGTFVHFLDSDDLVHPDKYTTQLRVHRELGADVTYDDLAVTTLGPDYTIAGFTPATQLATVTEAARLFLEVQPAPHGPLYRRDYLQAALAQPLVVPRRAMDPAGDVWLYYNLSVHPARVAKINAAHTAAGPHDEDRYSRQWERLGVAALLVMEEFIRACPANPPGLAAKTAAGEAAFRSWRALPRGFHDRFAARQLAIWQRAPRGRLDRLGSGGFARLAGLIGPLAAARFLRLWRAQPYASVRTLSPEAYDRLFAESLPHAAMTSSAHVLRAGQWSRIRCDRWMTPSGIVSRGVRLGTRDAGCF